MDVAHAALAIVSLMLPCAYWAGRESVLHRLRQIVARDR